MTDGLAGKLEGGVFIGVDRTKEGDTFVEFRVSATGVVEILDFYQTQKGPQNEE